MGNRLPSNSLRIGSKFESVADEGPENVEPTIRSLFGAGLSSLASTP